MFMDADAGNPLLDYFIANSNRKIHKWLGYFDVYHRVLAPYRGRPIKFLEIGIQNGGSAHMWRNYLGTQATVVGVDIDPQCRSLEAEGFEVWIGDQADPAFWQQLLEKHPSFDVVLDDGGHTMQQQIVTFNALFPALRNGGLFICEDTHTSYFPAHGGGLKRAGTFHEFVKELIDQQHAWYHQPLAELNQGGYLARHLYALSVYESIVVMEKRLKNPPLALVRGGEGHVAMPQTGSYIDLRRAFGVPD